MKMIVFEETEEFYIGSTATYHLSTSVSQGNDCILESLNHFLQSRLPVPRKGYRLGEAETDCPYGPLPQPLGAQPWPPLPSATLALEKGCLPWEIYCRLRAFCQHFSPCLSNKDGGPPKKSPFQKCAFLLLCAVRSLK